MKNEKVVILSLCLILVFGLSFILAENNTHPNLTHSPYNGSSRPYITYNESNRTINSLPNRTLHDLQNRTLPNVTDKNARRDINRNINRGDNQSIYNNSNKSIEKIRKENYGSCISNETKIRNSCFKSKEESFKTCEKKAKDQMKNESFIGNFTAWREMRKQVKGINNVCKNDYKISLNECKTSFNSSKSYCDIWKCNSNQTLVNGTCVKN